MDRFRNILVIVNPVSTRAARAQAHIRRLSALLPPQGILILPTSPQGRIANQALLRAHQAHLSPDSLLAIAAGDGTTSLLTEALLTDPALSPDARRTPVLPLWAGNANDLAHMLNGPVSRADLPELLRTGRIIAIRPLAVRLTHPATGTTTRLATNYATFGASATAAAELDRPSHRNDPVRETLAGRTVSELATVTRAMLNSPRFTLQEGSHTRRVYERLYINGSRMAKATAVPLKLTDPHFYHVTVEHKLASALARHAFELTNPATAHNFATTHDAFTVKEPVWAQFDGEPIQLAADTHVQVSRFERPFYALSQLL